MSLVAPSQLSTTTVPAKIAWSAKNGEDSIVRYELQQSVNGSSYSAVSLPAPTATNIIKSFKAGNTYRFRVRAQDEAGNWSDWTSSSSFPLRDNLDSISTGGLWTAFTGAAYSSFYKSDVKYASGVGSYASLSFTGRDVAWVAHKASNRGKAEVWIDGAKAATLDLYSPTTQERQVVFRKSWSSSGNHTIEVRVLGTKNASSSGTRVDVDDFITIK